MKLIGDEAMFVVGDPVDACRLALAMVERSADLVRVGLAHGPAVVLPGDYYGLTVNLAARLVDVAPPSAVVVSDAIRDSAGVAIRLELFPTGGLRGFPEVTAAYRLTGDLPPTVQ